jgi:hypothetical protein
VCMGGCPGQKKIACPISGADCQIGSSCIGAFGKIKLGSSPELVSIWCPWRVQISTNQY